MKKLENRFRMTCNIIIAGLLTILGFSSSCERGDSGGITDMYGTPSAKFIINGNVESSESDQVIKNIKVTLSGNFTNTDVNGNYIINTAAFPISQSFNINFQDIDSTLNGQFQDLDTTLVFNNPEFTGGDGHWYAGETSKEFNIKLKPKK